jgi:CHAT domain-containing protein
MRGEGMIGLNRAFIYAGVPAIVVSLWPVSDRSTAKLMKNLYENLVIQKLSRDKALGQAQIDMMKDEEFAHPFYWAPFVLIGDWR